MTSTAFGRLVRGWRDRVSPEAAGLPLGGRRRVAGLRREELADLAGISVDYLTRLEQGRADNPSAQIVEALCRALRVTDGDRRQLFHTAGLVPPGQGTVPTHITPGVQRILDRLSSTPVSVADATWNLLVANPPYTALMGEFHGSERNAIWRNFLGSGSRIRYDAAARHALELVQVTELRDAARNYPADTRLRRLITQLRTGSRRFADLWDSQAVHRNLPTRKTVEHPRVGIVNLDCDVLSVAGADLRIVVYTAEPGSRDAERLELATVLGTQSLTG
ncbi:MAG: helix-turn-helix transcriptional regulator [Stackebrandtia sp.]